MTIYKSNNFDNPAIPPHSAGEVYVSDDTVDLPDDIEADDIAKVGHLPLDCMPLDLLIFTEELDEHGTDTLRFTVGLLNDAGDDLVSGSELLVDAQAEAVKTIRGDAADGFLGIDREEFEDRVLAVKFTAVAATGAAGAMRAILSYRATNYGA